MLLQSASQALSYRNHRQVRRAESPVRSISVHIPRPQLSSNYLLAPKFWQAGGCITTSVMISEVLFGYFLFKEKVTDAPRLKQAASHYRNRSFFLLAESYVTNLADQKTHVRFRFESTSRVRAFWSRLNSHSVSDRNRRHSEIPLRSRPQCVVPLPSFHQRGLRLHDRANQKP